MCFVKHAWLEYRVRAGRIVRGSFVVRFLIGLGLGMFVLVVLPLVGVVLIVGAPLWLPVLACWLAWLGYRALVDRW